MAKNSKLAKRKESVAKKSSEDTNLTELKETILRNLHNQDDRALAESFEVFRAYKESKSGGNLKKFNIVCADYLNTIAVESGLSLKRSVCHQDSDAVMAIRKKLMDDLSPKNTAESMLIDLMINAYIRSMRLSAICSSLALSEKNITTWGDEREGMIKVLTKQLDQASKQFMHALTTFKSLRQTPVNVNIKTDSAYLAQAQQFNQEVSESVKTPEGSS